MAMPHAAAAETPTRRLPARRPARPAAVSPKAQTAGSGSADRPLLQTLGLRRVRSDQLAIRRERRGKRFAYLSPDGAVLRDPATIDRLNKLAVPPAYEDVRYAEDPRAHLQAIGRDAAGRLQYRYHPEWEKVREIHKARRLQLLVKALPRIRRSIAQRLASHEPTREFALSAVIELISRSAIRPGSESYARMHGSRGAATLLKTNVVVQRDLITLTFRGKGGKAINREFRALRLAQAMAVLRQLPGRRLFQYREADGTVREVRRREVNVFLRELAGLKIALKDFRTLIASAAMLEALAQFPPANTARGRRRQVLQAVRGIAEELANTPTVCRRSYVHDTVVDAFEAGTLVRYAAKLKGCRSPTQRERALARVIAVAPA